MSGTTFIIGKNGLIASKIISAQDPRLGRIMPTSSTSDKGCLRLDLCASGDFEFGAIEQGDVVLLLASISSPDICRNEHARAYAVNVTGTRRFIEGALRRKARVIFFSSDTVYGRSEAPIDETSAPAPFGEYAAMKHEIEQEFLSCKTGFKVLRLSYVFSRDDKFTAYLRDCAANARPAEIYDPLMRRTVYIGDVIEAVCSLVRGWDEFPHPVLNLCGPQLVSRLDMAMLYKKATRSGLVMNVSRPDEAFYASRPDVINMGSRHMEALIKRRCISLAEAMEKELTDSGEADRV